MIRPLSTLTPTGALLLALIAGHFIGDFLFQSRRMVDGKARLPVLGGHVLLVVLAHFVVLLPWLSWSVAGTVVVIGAVHALIDRAKSRWPWKRPGSLGLFVWDQTAHLVVVCLGALFLVAVADVTAARVGEATLERWLSAAVLLAAFAFTWTGGSTIVSAVLERLSPDLERREEGSGLRGSGHLIGILERTLALILILFGQWDALALLIAAKSVARFEELKERHFAEYYLVGTLTSLIVAVVVSLALMASGL
ncbi:MAG: DUF3307 domain-containing protein [Gemmatimonadota bacterium]